MGSNCIPLPFDFEWDHMASFGQWHTTVACVLACLPVLLTFHEKNTLGPAHWSQEGGWEPCRQIQPSWAWPPSARTGHQRHVVRPQLELGLDQLTQEATVWGLLPQQYLQLQAESVDIQKGHSLRLFREAQGVQGAWGWGKGWERSWPWCFWHKQLVWCWCLTEVKTGRMAGLLGKMSSPLARLAWDAPVTSGGMCCWQWTCMLPRWWAELKDGPVTFAPRPTFPFMQLLASVCPCWNRT